MRKLRSWTLAALVLGVGLTACSEAESPTEAVHLPVFDLALENPADGCFDLLAGAGTDGQNTVAGSVCFEVIDNGGSETLEVTYTAFAPWEFDEYHLWVGEVTDDDGDGSPDAMPQNKFGSPKLGQFPYKEIKLSGGDPVMSIVVNVDLAEFGGEEALCGETLAVVAHAVVASDTDGDGILDSFPTGFGAGYELGGNSWSMGVELTFGGPTCGICLDALEHQLDEIAGDDQVVGLKVSHNGGNSGLPYFTGQIDYDYGPDYPGDPFNPELTGLEVFCIDLDHTIYSNQPYCALLFSSYSESFPYEIKQPGNFDKANFVLNTFAIGDDLGNGATVTGGDIQRVLWALIYGTLPGPGAYSSGPSNNDNVNDMLAAAEGVMGEYVVPCDGVVAVIVYPVNCDTGAIQAQALIAQALVTTFPQVCEVCQ